LLTFSQQVRTRLVSVLGQSAGALTRTNEFHLASDGGNGQFAATERTRDPMNPDGQKVSLEQELIDGSSTRRSYELNTAIVKSFHRMMLMTARAS